MKKVVVVGLVVMVLLICVGLAMHLRVDPVQLFGWFHGR